VRSAGRGFSVAGGALLLAAAAAAPAVSKPKGGDNVDEQRRIEIPITIIKQRDLDFGRVVMLGDTASVIVSANGLPVYAGAVALGAAGRPARFEIQGPPNRSVELRLTFPVDGRYGFRGTAKLDGLSVRPDFTTGFVQEGSTIRMKLDSSGHNGILVGGKLSLTTATPGRTDILFPITVTVTK